MPRSASAWCSSSMRWPDPASGNVKQVRVRAGRDETEESMQQRQGTGELSRRQVLAVAGGLGIAPYFAAHGAPAPGASREATRIMTRPIPSTGEQLPVVGLGT